MRAWKKVVAGLLLLFLAIQFIRPAKNEDSVDVAMGITRIIAIPAKIQSRLETSCYDCHSNHTNYPWYARIEPVGWWLANHIKEGKAELNFNEFGKYSRRRQLSKLKAISESIKDGSMPLSSYTLIHRDARLSTGDKKMIMDWAEHAKDSLTQIYEQ